MGSSANEDDLLRIACAAKAIDQQKVAANMAFAMICPIPGQRMIEPLSAKGASRATSSSIASFSRVMSYRPECESRVQSFTKAFVRSEVLGRTARLALGAFFEVMDQRNR